MLNIDNFWTEMMFIHHQFVSIFSSSQHYMMFNQTMKLKAAEHKTLGVKRQTTANIIAFNIFPDSAVAVKDHVLDHANKIGVRIHPKLHKNRVWWNPEQ